MGLRAPRSTQPSFPAFDRITAYNDIPEYICTTDRKRNQGIRTARLVDDDSSSGVPAVFDQPATKQKGSITAQECDNDNTWPPVSQSRPSYYLTS